MLGALRRRGRLIKKDPIANLSSDWLAKNLNLEVIILVRHRAAFSASLKRLKWEYPFEHLLEQEMLMQEHLEIYRTKIASKPENIVEQAAIVWKCVYGVLSRGPLQQPRSRAEGPVKILGLRWTTTVESDVVKYTRSGNPMDVPEGTVPQLRRDSAANVSRWKKILTKEDSARVYEVTRRYLTCITLTKIGAVRNPCRKMTFHLRLAVAPSFGGDKGPDDGCRQSV